MSLTDYLLFNPQSDTFYVNLDQVDIWHNPLKHENHNVVVIENERYEELIKNIESGKEKNMIKLPIYKEADGGSVAQGIAVGEDIPENYHSYKRQKITAFVSMLCFGYILFYCLSIIKKYYEGACMFTIIAIISAFVMVISAFMFLIYWAYGSDER